MHLDITKKKIRYIIKSLDLGGTERHLLQLTTELSARGYRISILTLTDNNPLQKKFETHGIPIKVLELPKLKSGFPKPIRKIILGLVSVIKLRKIFIEEPMPTHFFLPYAYIFGMFANILSGKKGITFMSRRSLNEYQKKLPGFRLAEKFLHDRVTAILGNSKAVINQLIEEGVAPDKIHLIYNGVYSDRIAMEQSSKSLPVLADIFIYCIGNFISYKGHLDLIEAMASLKGDEFPNWHVVCFGRDDGILPALRTYADEKGISNRFSWVENESEPWRFMKTEQIGVLPSHQEGFSNAILEMMACKLAVVATDVGGNREALDGLAGIIVPSRKPTELRNSIQALLESNKLRSEYARRAREKAEYKFSVPACIDSYELVYAKYLDRFKY